VTRVVVVGDGIVGRRVVRHLRSDGLDARTCRGISTVADLGALAAGDVVVLAHPPDHAPLAASLCDEGVSVVSVSDALNDVQELIELDDRFRANGSTLVAGAALSPGLSDLLARHLARQLDRCDEIHVAVHATAGPACARQHHRALRGSAVGWHDGAWIERTAGSGRELCWFPEPVGARDCYRAEIPSPLLLHHTFPEVGRISARMSATRRDRLTARLPMMRSPHPEGGVGAVRVEVRGASAGGERVALVAGVAEIVGTSASATAAAFAVAAASGTLPPGLVAASDERLDTVGLLRRVARYGVRLQEFTGVPQHA
jgi:hypothetical protein